MMSNLVGASKEGQFPEWFEIATGGLKPYRWQLKVALNGLPDVPPIPTGLGKTEVVLAWAWRLLHRSRSRCTSCSARRCANSPSKKGWFPANDRGSDRGEKPTHHNMWEPEIRNPSDHSPDPAQHDRRYRC